MINKIRAFIKYQIKRARKDTIKGIVSFETWLNLILIGGIIFNIYGKKILSTIAILIGTILIIIRRIINQEKLFNWNLDPRLPPLWRVIMNMFIIVAIILLMIQHLSNYSSFVIKYKLVLLALILAIICYIRYEWTKGHWKVELL